MMKISVIKMDLPRNLKLYSAFREFTVKAIAILQEKLNQGESITPRFIEDISLDKEGSPFLDPPQSRYFSIKPDIGSLLRKHMKEIKELPSRAQRIVVSKVQS